MRVTGSKESISQSKSNREFSTIMSPYIAALRSRDLSRDVNERRIANVLIERQISNVNVGCKNQSLDADLC
jgi:hypothetical protein